MNARQEQVLCCMLAHEQTAELLWGFLHRIHSDMFDSQSSTADCAVVGGISYDHLIRTTYIIIQSYTHYSGRHLIKTKN